MGDPKPTAGPVIPQPPERSILNRRGLSAFGGYALSQTPCPADTTSCGSSSCCPIDYSCDSTYSFARICCPGNSTDCSGKVSLLKACANNDWGLYSPAAPRFYCCLPGMIGAGSDYQGYQCMDKALPIPSSLEIASLTQATGTRSIASAATSGSSGSSSGSGASLGSGSGGSSQGSALSTGAIATIAVLSTLVVILLIVVVLMWYFYNKRLKKQAMLGNPVTVVEPKANTEETSAKLGTTNVPYIQANELPGEGGRGAVQELDSRR